jgi:hypothetical protein
MLVIACPWPTWPARRQLFENCQVYLRAPSEQLEAETLQILAWRSITLIVKAANAGGAHVILVVLSVSLLLSA